ncbi:MAG TPA: hypothetical protein PLW48_05010 [Alphaproteobacteria bacterium]|nr:hypothetical protein [Rhodospirillaceae bacterium]HRJ66476.1 hypothetical protein [Alphaproteobacteria bacterium]
MSETRFPSSPPASGAVSSGGDKPLVQNALVTQAPLSITDAARSKTLLLDGQVTGHNAQRGETTITTAKGDIVIQTGQSGLPLGAEVSLELKMQGLSLRANITALRARNTEARAAQDMARPPAPQTPPPPAEAPPLRAGDKVLALRLPDTPPPAADASTQPSPSAPPVQKPTLEQAAQIIEAVRAAVGIARMAMLMPSVPEVPLPVIWQVLNTRDVMTALVRLPEAMQTQLLEYLARPDVAASLRQILPAAQATTLLPPLPQGQDADIMMQAQMALRPAQPSGSPLPATAAGMAGFFPLLESMMPAGAASLMTLGKLPQMQGGQNLPLPQNMMQITVHDVILPPNAAPAARPAGSVLAVVESLTASGVPVIRTPDAHFVLRQSAALPVGTQIIMTLTPATAQDIMAALPPMGGTQGLRLFDPLFSGTWGALEDALLALSASSPAAAQNMLQTIPAATTRLAPTSLFFLAALRMGNIESWLGENALQALRSGGKRELAERLTQDFAKLASLSKTAIAGEWRAISMPLLQQDQHVHLIQFFLRQPPPDDAGEDGEGASAREKTTRFILNLHLSRMGDMQLDGFVQKKRFDLIMRAEESLPAAIRQEILQKFTAGLEQSGMEGSMRFQTRAEQWVVVPDSAGGDTQA